MIRPVMLNKPHGVPRADDRQMLNDIPWRFRKGSPRAEVSQRYRPSTIRYDQLRALAHSAVWD
ncbi:hypothetical protein [Novosphingobium chloroacetimidivorans]|uniref:hypothetical protein n=1 Tax=Novosphingobium chloroacetimidivorans TaxID=1428314 RepID=UPI001C883199